MIRRPPRSTLFPSTPLFRSRSHAVHRAPPAGADDAGGLLELHYRRSCDLRALAHPLAVEDRHLLPLAVEVGLPAPALHLTLGGTLLERGFVHGHGGDEAHVHELYGLVLHPVTVSPLVRSVEALLQLAYLERLLGLDRELEGLSPVAQIGPAGVLRTLQVLRGLALHALEELLELPDVRVGEVREVGAYVVPAQVGDREAQGAEDPSRPGDEHGLHAELFG